MNVANVTGTPEAQTELFAGMAAVLGDVQKLEKAGENTYFKYKFATDGDVSDLIRPLLAKQGVAIFVSMVGVDSGDFAILAEFSITYAKSGATFTCNWFSEAQDKQDKGINKAATAALKYHLLKNFLISTGEKAMDTDSQDQVEGAKKPKVKQKEEDVWIDNNELDAAWKAWELLMTKAILADVEVPDLLKFDIQPIQLRKAYKELNDLVKAAS